MPAAAINAGLSSNKVSSLLSIVSTPALATDYSPAVVAAVGGAVRGAYVHGVQVVAFASLGFGAVGLIACLCCKDVNSKMNDNIEAFIDGEEEKAHNHGTNHHTPHNEKVVVVTVQGHERGRMQLG